MTNSNELKEILICILRVSHKEKEEKKVLQDKEKERTEKSLEVVLCFLSC